jgi:hypothetical protein
MSMYVKLKRQKQTIFLHCEKDETIRNLKEKVMSINKVPVENQAIYISKEGDDPLGDDVKLQDAKIFNDSILYLVFKDSEDNWEPIEIFNPQDFKEEEEEEDLL